jgi:hypothetical protein
MLMMGGLAIAGVLAGIYILSPTMFEDLKYGVMRIFNPNTPAPPGMEALSPEQEEEQASMYAGYY